MEPRLEGGKGVALHDGRFFVHGKGRPGRLRILLQLCQAAMLRSLFQDCLLQRSISIGNGSLLGLQLLLSLLELAGLGGLSILKSLQLSLHRAAPILGFRGLLSRQVMLDSSHAKHLLGLLRRAPRRLDRRVGLEPSRD